MNRKWMLQQLVRLITMAILGYIGGFFLWGYISLGNNTNVVASPYYPALRSVMLRLAIISLFGAILPIVGALHIVDKLFYRRQGKYELSELETRPYGYSIRGAIRIDKSPDAFIITPDPVATWSAVLLQAYVVLAITFAFLPLFTSPVTRAVLFNSHNSSYMQIILSLVGSMIYVVLFILMIYQTSLPLRVHRKNSILPHEGIVRIQFKHKLSQHKSHLTTIELPIEAMNAAYIKPEKVQSGDFMINTHSLVCPANDMKGEVPVMDALRTKMDNPALTILSDLDEQWLEQAKEVLIRFANNHI